jgi:hypothetical protein
MPIRFSSFKHCKVQAINLWQSASGGVWQHRKEQTHILSCIVLLDSTAQVHASTEAATKETRWWLTGSWSGRAPVTAKDHNTEYDTDHDLDVICL